MLFGLYKKYRYFYPKKFEEAYDPFYSNAKWKLCFAWFPHYCEISNRQIWLEKAYCGQRYILVSNDDDPIVEERWHCIKEHLLWKTKHHTL